MEMEKIINGTIGLITAITALIGSVAALLKAISDYRKNRQKKVEGGIHKAPVIIHSKKKIYFFGILLLFISISIFTLRFINNSTYIEINYPNNNSFVTINETVRGTSENIPINKSIWIVIITLSPERYFPNHTPVQKNENGEWSSEITIGSSADDGKEFYIATYMLDSIAVKELKNNFNRIDFDGLERMPNNAVLYNKIIVKRKLKE